MPGYWSDAVAIPTMKLATRTMVDLSKGFGRGTAIAAIACWVVALMEFIQLLKLMEMDDPTKSMDDNLCSKLGAQINRFCRVRVDVEPRQKF